VASSDHRFNAAFTDCFFNFYLTTHTMKILIPRRLTLAVLGQHRAHSTTADRLRQPATIKIVAQPLIG
jgi:hypothetical protein